MTHRPMIARLAALVVLSFAAEASAQVSARLTGGMTRAAEEEPFVAGGLAARLGVFEIEAEGGRLFDVLPDGLLDRLNDLQRERGLPVQAIATLPATYALGHLRLVSSVGPVQPFVGVGGGLARLEPQFDVVVDGISLGDVFGLARGDTVTEPLVTAGAGVRIDLERVTLDVGYRYLGILTDFGFENGFEAGRTDINAVYGTLGFVF